MLTIKNIEKIRDYHIHHGQWSIIKVVDIHVFPTYYDLTIQHQSQYLPCTIQREYSSLTGYCVECDGWNAYPDSGYLSDILHVLNYIATFVIGKGYGAYHIEDANGVTIFNQP